MQGPLDSPLLLWTIAAGVADLMAITVYTVARRKGVAARAWCVELARLLKALRYKRAVKLCEEAPQGTLVRLTLFILSLEVPADGETRHRSGPGEARAETDFAGLMRQKLDAEVAARRREVHMKMALVAAAMTVALGLGAFVLMVYLLGDSATRSRFFPWPLVAGLVPLLGLALTAFGWYRQVTGIDKVVFTLLPFLRPAEQMEPQAREAAAEARRILARTE